LTEKVAKLWDGTEVLIRPLRTDDLEQSFAFFKALPEEDRAYLRVDVTKRDLVERRIHTALGSDCIERIVAVSGMAIVADGTLEIGDHDWDNHIAEIRLIVASSEQRRGLGTLVARELYTMAAEKKVEEIIVKMMRPQKAARGIFRKLGFREEILFPDYVKDMKGSRQDMIVMRCDLEALWKKMEDFVDGSDWQRTR